MTLDHRYRLFETFTDVHSSLPNFRSLAVRSEKERVVRPDRRNPPDYRHKPVRWDECKVTDADEQGRKQKTTQLRAFTA
jgi:hypothetical protein